MNHSEAPKMQVNSDRTVRRNRNEGELSPTVIERRTIYVGVGDLARRWIQARDSRDADGSAKASREATELARGSRS